MEYLNYVELLIVFAAHFYLINTCAESNKAVGKYVGLKVGPPMQIFTASPTLADLAGANAPLVDVQKDPRA